MCVCVFERERESGEGGGVGRFKRVFLKIYLYQEQECCKGLAILCVLILYCGCE